MHYFYLQCSPSCNWFDLWNVEHLLSLLEHCAPASSFTMFKLSLKRSTHLALVMAKCGSDLSLLHIDNQHHFLQHHAAIFIAGSVGKTNWLGHISPQIHIVNLCSVFYLKAFLHCTELLRRGQMDLMCSWFLGRNRQHMSVCAKTIFSWVRKVLSITEEHMSPSTLHGTLVAAALVGGVSWGSIQQAGDWARVANPARHYFTTSIITMD